MFRVLTGYQYYEKNPIHRNGLLFFLKILPVIIPLSTFFFVSSHKGSLQ